MELDKTSSTILLEIKKYFPENNENNNEDFYKSLKIDTVGRFSISLPYDAQQTTLFILNKLHKKNILGKSFVITDATAGVGGNTLSFCKHFKHVNAIELDAVRHHYLINNITQYNYQNITYYNVDYLEIMHQLRQDIIFIDPPWGGKKYKYRTKLKIVLSGQSFETILMKLIHCKLAKYIVLKLPMNYDFDSFNNCINHNEKMILNNMYLVIIDVGAFDYHR